MRRLEEHMHSLYKPRQNIDPNIISAHVPIQGRVYEVVPLDHQANDTIIAGTFFADFLFGKDII